MKKLCKRMLALVVALVLVSGTFTAIPAFGSELSYDGYVVGDHSPTAFWIDVLSSSAAPGQYVDAVLVISYNTLGLNTLALTIAYDSDILQSVSVIPGNTVSLSMPPPAGENPMQLNFYSANSLENFMGEGHLAVIRFRIHDNAPSGSTPITVTPVHAYHITDNLDLVYSRVHIPQGGVNVNVCSPYCECLSCTNESGLSKLLMIFSPPRPIHINRWQAYIGDVGLPTTLGIVVTPVDFNATANVSWGPLVSLYPPWDIELHLRYFYTRGTVTLPDNVINSSTILTVVWAGVNIWCLPTCACPICEYEAWRAEIERQRIAYEEWRAWEAAVAQAQAAYQEYRAWRTEVEEAEAAHQAYLDWLAEIERQRVAYEEWRDWLCATNQCDQCDRCS